MVSYKQRMEILDSLGAHTLDSAKALDYLKYVDDPLLKKPLLRKIFSALVTLDTEISAAYDELDDDEDWDTLFAACDSPLPDSLQLLKDRIDLFSTNFLRAADALGTCALQDVVEIIEPVFKNQTRNIQFVLLRMDGLDRLKFFGMLVGRMARDAPTYVPFFCSLYVRWAMPDDVNDRCFNAYMKYLARVPLSTCVSSIVSYQSLLYILCFKPGHYTPTVRGLVERMHGAGLLKLMNKQVVEMFCGVCDFKYAGSFVSAKHECLYIFPFDFPICKVVQDAVSASYNQFDAGDK
ncbi:hypothetical protein PAPHI01_0475 [Pancytospora philotis]|nr:hypothetical protein PAPHI01_0475 [Pancytospora philotis]